jgi:hypothetical protein
MKHLKNEKKKPTISSCKQSTSSAGIGRTLCARHVWQRGLHDSKAVQIWLFPCEEPRRRNSVPLTISWLARVWNPSKSNAAWSCSTEAHAYRYSRSTNGVRNFTVACLLWQLLLDRAGRTESWCRKHFRRVNISSQKTMRYGGRSDPHVGHYSWFI